MKTGIAYSKKYLEHDLGPNHPEKPERLESIIKSLKEKKSLFEKTKIIKPHPASFKDIELAHDSSYIKEIKQLSESGKMVDLDTPTNPNTFELALLAAGGTINLTKKVNKKNIKNGFALVRPPGHHATRNSGGGFCYFNNLAIATKKILGSEDINRVLIFDFDSHHGNGTQDIFYSDDEVLYISFHQDGRTLYPGTGFPEEVGEGDGEGFTANIPFPPESSNENYAAALKEFLIPLSREFNPDLIMVSTGLDAHKKDPLTQLQLSKEGFGGMAKTILEQARKLCNGRIVFVLEGGYAIEAGAKSALKIIESLADPKPPNLPEGEETSSFQEVRNALRPYWDI